MIKVVVITLIVIIAVMAIAQKMKENEPLGIILYSNRVPIDVFPKFQEYMRSRPKVKNVAIVSWNESTKILEYDDGKRLYTLKLREDGFHRVKGIGD